MFLSVLAKAIARKFGIKICRITWRDLHPFEIIKKLPDENKPTTILDVGAHVGQTAMALARQFPDARIHCLEPFPQTYESLS